MCQAYLPQLWSNLSYSGRIYVIRGQHSKALLFDYHDGLIIIVITIEMCVKKEHLLFMLIDALNFDTLENIHKIIFCLKNRR